MLLGGILTAGGALLATAFLVGLPAGRDTFAFMAAEVSYKFQQLLHVGSLPPLRISSFRILSCIETLSIYSSLSIYPYHYPSP